MNLGHDVCIGNLNAESQIFEAFFVVEWDSLNVFSNEGVVGGIFFVEVWYVESTASLIDHIGNFLGIFALFLEVKLILDWRFHFIHQFFIKFKHFAVLWITSTFQLFFKRHVYCVGFFETDKKKEHDIYRKGGDNGL